MPAAGLFVTVPGVVHAGDGVPAQYYAPGAVSTDPACTVTAGTFTTTGQPGGASFIIPTATTDAGAVEVDVDCGGVTATSQYIVEPTIDHTMPPNVSDAFMLGMSLSMLFAFFKGYSTGLQR